MSDFLDWYLMARFLAHSKMSKMSNQSPIRVSLWSNTVQFIKALQFQSIMRKIYLQFCFYYAFFFFSISPFFLGYHWCCRLVFEMMFILFIIITSFSSSFIVLLSWSKTNISLFWKKNFFFYFTNYMVNRHVIRWDILPPLSYCCHDIALIASLSLIEILKPQNP